MTRSDDSGEGAGAFFPGRFRPFSDLDGQTISALTATAQVVRPNAAGVLFRAGMQRRGLALLVRGSLDVQPEPGAVLPTALAEHELADDVVWERDIRGSDDAIALVLDDRTLRRAYLRTPDVFRDVDACAGASALQARLSAMLRKRSLFRQASASLLDDMETELPVRFHRGGEQVFANGGCSDHMLVLITGMMRASATDADGKTRMHPPVGPGAAVGELGVVLDQPHIADVTAVRDCESLVVDRSAYDRLLDRYPAEVNRIVCRSIHDQIGKAGVEARFGERPRTLAVVSLSDPALALAVANELMPALGFLGRAGILTRVDNEAMAELGRGADTATFNAIERSVDVLLYVSDEADEAWLERCLRQADHVLFIAEWDDETRLRPVECRQREDRSLSMKDHSLVLLHPADAPGPRRTREWRANRPGCAVHHLRRGVTPDAGRVARTLMGAARGLVLGGGGARGFAHVGVLRALASKGIAIDVVGGNSMGALIGAQFARGDAPDAILERTLACARNGEVPTVPLISLIDGRRFRRALEQMFEGLAFEDLWTPFFTVACDLSAAETRVMDTGLLYRGVLASNSPAGIMPPFVENGHLLVDGAILNNVPVDVMRARVGRGRVIAVDVNQRRDLVVEADLARLSPVDAAKRLIFRRRPRLPGLQEILVRAGIVGGIAHRDRTRALADLYIEPPVSQYSLIGYGRAKPIAAAGEQAALAQLADWTP